MMDPHDVSAYASSVRINPNTPLSRKESEDILVKMVGRMAAECVRMGAAFIGHIKCVAYVPSGECLACSVTDMDGAVSCAGALGDGMTRLDLIVNVLVYGIDQGALGDHMERELVRTIESTEASASIMTFQIEKEDETRSDRPPSFITLTDR